MLPVLFTIGGFPIHTYGVAAALGFLVVTKIMVKRMEAFDVASEKVVDLLFWSAIAGIVGARALYIYKNPGQLAPSEWINLRTGGLVFYGSVLTAFPMGAYLIKKHKLPYYKIMDAFVLGAPIGHAISRFGCLGAGCCHGTPTDLPWGITFTDALSIAPQNIALHPTQLYEVVGLCILAFGLHKYYPRRAFDGAVALAYFCSYAVLRSIIEIFRGDTTRGWMFESVLGETISTSQGISLMVAVVAFVIFFVAARKNTKPTIP